MTVNQNPETCLSSKQWPQLRPSKPNDDQTFTNTPPEGIEILNLYNSSSLHSCAVLSLPPPLHAPQGTSLHITYRPSPLLVQTPHLYRSSPALPRYPRTPPMARHHDPTLVHLNTQVDAEPISQQLPKPLRHSIHMEILCFDRGPSLPYIPSRLSRRCHRMAVASLILL